MVYRWNGTEFVPDAQDSAFGCTLMDIADLDGNGKQDILCVSLQQAASIFYVDDAGQISAPSYMAMASPNAAAQLKLDDVTGDGRPDALMISAGVWAFFMYANDGAGGFLPAQAYAFSTGFTSSAIEAFDVDGDAPTRS